VSTAGTLMRPDFRAGAMLYGLNLTACTGALYLNWRYASNRGHVMVQGSDVVVMERFRTGVAWFSPITGFYLYVAIAVIFAYGQMRSKAMERMLHRTR